MLIVTILSFFLTASAVPDVVSESVEVIQDVSSGDVVPDSSGNDISVLADLLSSIDENLEVMALDTTVDAYQVSDYYREYFKGVLQNMGYTEYLCYAERVPISGSSGYYNYITHYYLIYDLDIVGGQIVSGSYPCLDVYSSNNVYYLDEYEKEFEGYPTIGFASFAPYSALIDRSFPWNDFIVGVLCVLLLYVVGKKHLFS